MASFRDHGQDSGPRRKRRAGRPQSAIIQLSKRLTFALRHGASELGLRMRPDGFVVLDELLRHPRFRAVSKDQVEHVVSSDEKGRMTIISEEGSGLLIRANQGHSLKGLVDEEQLLLRVNAATDIPICVHGTFLRHWPSIRDEGLKCMRRTHIHFAAGLAGEQGVISGMRKSCQVLIYVDVGAAMSDGIAFFRSSNNVILTSGKSGTLGPAYFSRVDFVSDVNPGIAQGFSERPARANAIADKAQLGDAQPCSHDDRAGSSSTEREIGAAPCKLHEMPSDSDASTQLADDTLDVRGNSRDTNSKEDCESGAARGIS